MMPGLFRKVVLLAGVSWLLACSNSMHAPVIELQQPPGDNDQYIVQKGDTLFSIAWRYDVDYRQVAAYNNIPEPYVIKPGQAIYLAEDMSQQRSPVVTSKPPVGDKTIESSPKPVKNKKNTGVVAQKKVENTSGTLQNVNDKGWVWPIAGNKGRLIQPFALSGAVNKGVDIKAAAGEKIRATRSGKVVYSGSQLKGYGNLVILKHDEIYLSAYAHNRKILVKEGQLVNQGDVIAELGRTGTETDKLHFEIRKKGKPVNPMQYIKQ